MLQSKLLPKTRKEAPKDEVSLNARLLIRAGFIDKLMAGVYTVLPLGLRGDEKIENIVRSEMESTGGQELLMPALQPKENWQKRADGKLWIRFSGSPAIILKLTSPSVRPTKK